ncbi:hypothetical protein BGX21_004236, partial [Mortierella sp. AD011]
MNGDALELYAEYFNSREVEIMRAVDFFQFEQFHYKHRTLASQEWINVVLPGIGKINSKRARILRHEWDSKPQIRSEYWKTKMEDEEKKSHISAVLSEGRVQSIASVKSVTAETIEGLNSVVNDGSSGMKRQRRQQSCPSTPKKRVQKKEPTTPKHLAQTMEPFQSLIEIALEMPVTLPSMDSALFLDNVSTNRIILYKIGLANLHDARDAFKYPNPETNLPLKDAFVALSGIWNLYSEKSNSEFGELTDKARLLCLRPDLEKRDEEFNGIIEPLILLADSESSVDSILGRLYDIQTANPQHRRSLDMLKTILKNASQPLYGTIRKASEGDTMSLWSGLFRGFLPSTSHIALNLGEQGCAATKLSNSDLSSVFQANSVPRKCDCILTVDGLEVANFEAKKEAASNMDKAVQLRKNIKINKSILLELEKYNIECPPILNIH